MVTVRLTATTGNLTASSASPARNTSLTRAPILTRSRARRIAHEHEAQRLSVSTQIHDQIISDPAPAAPHVQPPPIPQRYPGAPVVINPLPGGILLLPSAGDPYYPPAWPWTTPEESGPRFTIIRKLGYVYPLAPIGRMTQVLKVFVDEAMRNRLPVADVSFFANRDGIAQSTIVDLHNRLYLITGYYDSACPVNANLIRICPIPWKGQLVVLGLGSRTRVLKRPAGNMADIEQVMRFFIRDCVGWMVQRNARKWPRLISLHVDLETIVM